MIGDIDLILENDLFLLSFEPELEVRITGEETFDLLIEGGYDVIIDNDHIKVLTVAEQGLPGVPGPAGQDGTKITIDEDAPPNPRPGDIWIPMGPGYIKGADGVDGQDGAPGVQGPKGDDGEQGIQGIQGPQGERGYTGDQGEKGDTGERGLQGIQGIQGVKGDTGLQGVKGDTGLQGIQGIQGIQGVPGTNGTNGTNGQGVPAAGTLGQKLQKTSATDYATAWVSVSRPMTASTSTSGATTTATISWAVNEVIRLQLSNTASVALTMMGAQDGQVCRLEIIQDATGGRALTLGTEVGFSTDIPSYTPTTGAGKRDILEFMFNSGTSKFYLTRVTKGF